MAPEFRLVGPEFLTHQAGLDGPSNATADRLPVLVLPASQAYRTIRRPCPKDRA